MRNWELIIGNKLHEMCNQVGVAVIVAGVSGKLESGANSSVKGIESRLGFGWGREGFGGRGES